MNMEIIMRILNENLSCVIVKNAGMVKDIKERLELEGNEVDAFCDTSAGRYVFSFDQLPEDISQHNAVSIF
jgi:hypothetical protein